MADGTPFARGYTWTKSVLQLRGLVSKAPKRSAHRGKRAHQAPARPAPEGETARSAPHSAGAGRLDLVVTLDDAASAMLVCCLVEEEGTASSFIGLKQTIAAHGLFSPLHRPRQPLLLHPQGRRASRQDPPDPGGCGTGAARHRAHPELLPGGPGAHGAAVRHAPEPPAPLLRQEGLASIEAANHWLATIYVAQHDAASAGSRLPRKGQR